MVRSALIRLWREARKRSSSSRNSMFFLNGRFGWIVGEGDTIIHRATIPVGLQQISTQAPAVFSLAQNFPNPFNPSTNIRFDISGKSLLQTVLSVYDILGKEIVVLVNEKLQPGEYNASFYAADLPSGVYYYKLNAGDFAETKKMVLVK